MPGITALYQKGGAVLVNLVPLADGEYSLILVPCDILGVDGEDKFGDSVRGWLRPGMGLPKFLEEYSNLGGTHHSCLCYGADIDVLAGFGQVMGWETHILK